MSEIKISAFVVARDEEDRIERCLRSIDWADERLVVVDASTRDATAARAEPLATDVVVRRWEGFSRTKQFALSRTRNRWAFWIDADEEVTPRLAHSIREAVASPRGRKGFRMRRRNFYLGHLIRHGAWSNDLVLRLFDREGARFDDRAVHESVEVDGNVGLLEGVLEHRSYRDLDHHFEKIRIWSQLWAKQAREDGKRARVSDLLLRPPLRFLKGYLLKGGMLDGVAGAVLALMDSIYVGMKYAKLLESQRTDRQNGEGK